MESLETIAFQLERLKLEESGEIPVIPPIAPIPGSIWEDYRPRRKLYRAKGDGIRKPVCIFPGPTVTEWKAPKYRETVDYECFREMLMAHSGVMNERPPKVFKENRVEWFLIPEQSVIDVEKSMLSHGFWRTRTVGQYASSRITARLLQDSSRFPLFPGNSPFWLCVMY